MAKKKQQPVVENNNLEQMIRRDRVILTSYNAVGIIFKGEPGGGRIITEPGQVTLMSEIASKAAKGFDTGEDLHPIYLEDQPYADFHMLDEVQKSEFLQQQHRDFTKAKEKYELEMSQRKEAAKKKRINDMIEKEVRERMSKTTTPTPPVKE